MKRMTLPCLAAALLAASACTNPKIEVVDFDSFHVTSVSNSDVLVAGRLNPEIHFMESGEMETKVAETNMTDFVLNLAGSLESKQLTHISGTYTGHDLDGSPITLSGKVLLPARGKIKNIIVVTHYTVAANFECPSESFPLEGVLASKGYALVMPDYIGYGVTRDRIHPYLHAESTARSAVDMLLAVQPYLEYIGRTPESEEIMIVGYSQGGAGAMAVMRMIQQEYYKEFPIRKVYAGGGPYDLAATFDVSMLEDLTGIPCAIPMIVQGINEGDGLGLNINDFFKPALQEHMDEWINSKNYTVKQVNELLNAKKVSDIMSDVGRDKKNPQTARLYRALMYNSVLDFTPLAPVYIFHSEEDGTVPFVNATKAEQFFKGRNVTYDFGPYGSHGTAAIRFVYNVYKDL